MLLSHPRRVRSSQSLLPRQPQLRVLQAGTLALYPDQPTCTLTQTQTYPPSRGYTQPHTGKLKYMLPHIGTLSSYVNTQKLSYLSRHVHMPSHTYSAQTGTLSPHTLTHFTCECPYTLTHALTPGPALTTHPRPTDWVGRAGGPQGRKEVACARNQLSGPHLEFLAQYGAGAPNPHARLAGGARDCGPGDSSAGTGLWG